MTKLTSTVLSIFLFTVSNAYSQNYIYKGSQQYPATNTWSFPTHTLNIPSSLELTVAKTKTGGFLMLAAEIIFDPEESIAGAVTLILSNGKIISLTQRLVKDHVDGKSQVLYSLSSTNFNLLKEYDIEKVRFSIVMSLDNSKKSFTANNDRTLGYSPNGGEKYYTAQEISLLND